MRTIACSLASPGGATMSRSAPSARAAPSPSLGFEGTRPLRLRSAGLRQTAIALSGWESRENRHRGSSFSSEFDARVVGGAAHCAGARDRAPLRSKRDQRRPQPRRVNTTQALQPAGKPAGVRHRDAVGRQGDGDRQRRRHHPDRHRPAACAARDRQRRPDPARGGRAPAPAGASQPDRRDAADPGRQGREDRRSSSRISTRPSSASPAT